MRATLRTAVGAWLKSIKDENVRKMASESVIVTGGSIASMLRKEPISDYDLYFTSRAALVAVVNYYAASYSDNVEILYGERKDIYVHNAIYMCDMEVWNPRQNYYTMLIENLEEDQVALTFGGSAGYEVKLKEGEAREPFSPLFFSANAITLTNGIQLILRFHGTPEEIHANFDFLHATNYYVYGKDEFVWNPEAILAATTGELRYVGSKYPLTSIIRIKKFLARGYTINAGEQLKMMFQISQLNLADPLVLSNQLAGVDISYFTVLINAMLTELNKDEDFKISPEWLDRMITVIFNKVDHDED